MQIYNEVWKICDIYLLNNFEFVIVNFSHLKMSLCSAIGKYSMYKVTQNRPANAKFSKSAKTGGGI